MSHTRAAWSGATILAVAGLLLAPSAATAADPVDGVDIYTWGRTIDEPAPAGFAALSPVDASLSLLSDQSAVARTSVGAEVCGGLGYAVLVAPEGTEHSVVTWDVASGAVLTSTPLAIELDSVFIWDIDTLEDCTLLAIGYRGSWPRIMEIGADGSVTDVVDLPAIPDPYEFAYYGIATSPEGVTHAFFFTADGPMTAIVDLDLGTVGPPFELEGVDELFSSTARVRAADFDSSGGLWLYAGIDTLEEWHLLAFPEGESLESAVPRDVGVAQNPEPGALVTTLSALAVTDAAPGPAPAPEPQLAATGTELPIGAVLAAGILLIAGCALAIARRRPEH